MTGRIILLSTPLLYFLTCCFFAPNRLNAQSATLAVHYICTEINAGYDYNFKIRVCVDGILIGESTPKFSSQANTLQLNIPSGQRNVKITGMKYYNGTWEESLKSNNYTVDSQFEQTLHLSGATAISLNFKMKTGTEVVSITSSGHETGSSAKPQYRV